MICDLCHADLPDQAHFCPMCGAVCAATGPTQRLSDADEVLCLRCRHTMEQGFVVEFNGSNRPQRSLWVAGIPETSFLWGIRIANRRSLYIRTYRCTHCGYLESYALDGDDGTV